MFCVVTVQGFTRVEFGHNAWIGVYNFFNFSQKIWMQRWCLVNTVSFFRDNVSNFKFSRLVFLLALGYYFVVVLFLVFSYFLSFSGLFVMMFTLSVAFYIINSLIWRHLYWSVVGNVSSISCFWCFFTPFLNTCGRGALISSFHDRFDLSTKPWMVGVCGEPWATWMPFSSQNVCNLFFANSLPLLVRICLENHWYSSSICIQ